MVSLWQFTILVPAGSLDGALAADRVLVAGGPMGTASRQRMD